MIGGQKMKKIFLIASFVLTVASLSAKQYPDSVMQAGKEEPNIAYGWNFEIGGGIGLGRYEYKQGTNFVSPHTTNQLWLNYNAQLGINYYFLPWMGIGTGVQFTTYANKAAVTVPWEQETFDKYYDPKMPDISRYTITSIPEGITERQDIYMLEVPFALKFRARPGVVGFTGTAGMKLGIPMATMYQLGDGGKFRNSVYYPLFDLTMQDVPNVVEDLPIAGTDRAYMAPEAAQLNRPSMRTLNYAVFGEVGMLFRLSQRTEMALAVYANYYVNDVMTSHSSSALGFGTNHTTGEYPMPYTTAYNGVLNTNEVESLHPWNVGLKISFQFNVNRTKAQREYDKEQRRLKKEAKEREKQIQDSLAALVPETPIIIEPEIIDTVIPRILEDTIAEDTIPCVRDTIRTREEAMDRIVQLAHDFNIDICEEICVPILFFVHDTIYITVDGQRVLPDAKQEVRHTEAGERLNEELKSAVIYFDLDKADPILEPKDILIRLAEVLRRHPDQKIHINGHACQLGKPNYNQQLALRRANAVADQLRALGVNEDQLLVASLGADMPYRYNGKHQLSKDRRVEIVPTYRTTEIVRPGSRLAQMARRHYGIPEFWVFIYEANAAKIPDPNNVNPGIEVVIPDLSDRLQGMTQKQAMEEAKRLKAEILKK